MEIKLSEKEIQHAIIQELQWRENLGELVFYRAGSFAGKFTRKDGSQGWIKNNKAGFADIVVYFDSGFVQFWEVKAKGGRQSDLQKQFENKITGLGFEYHVVSSLDQARNLIMLVQSRSRIKGQSHG